MKLDVLFFAAHPDDAEISAGGSIARWTAQGKKVGIVDLTRGELGSRGSAELRDQEAQAASKVLGISSRDNLKLADGFFEQNEESLRAVITMIRKYQPNIVIANSPSDRHPDHGRASKLVRDAAFFAGLAKIETSLDGRGQEKWRPKSVYFYIQDIYLKPDFVVDISEFWDKKEAALKCYGSQFYDPTSSEPSTPISGKEFFDFLKGRAYQMGRYATYEMGEGFIADRPIGMNDIFGLD